MSVQVIRRGCALRRHHQRWSLHRVSSMSLPNLALFTPAALCRYCLGNPNKSGDGNSESSKQTAAARMKTAPWFRFDDDVVTRVSLKEVLDAEAYIIM